MRTISSHYFNFQKYLNLQLFAEGAGGGDGGTGADGASGETAVAAVPQRKGAKANPLANVVYGKQEAEEARKRRTHLLIVCGAEIAALYGNPLEEDEIHILVNFLREQQNAGIFTLRKAEEAAAEEHQEPIAETNGKDEDIFGELFGF